MFTPMYQELARGCFAAIAHVLDAVGDPVGVLFDGEHHIALNARALGTGDHEHVGKVRDHDSKIGGWAIGPLVFERFASRRTDINPPHCTSHGIKTRSKRNGIKFVVGSVRAKPVWGECFDSVGADVDERDAVFVVGLEIVRIDNQAFGAYGMRLGAQGH